MNKKTVFMFSGQGSQYYHMGMDLYKNNTTFRNRMHDLDHIVSKLLGESILEIIYDRKRPKHENFNSLKYTHPAIFMVEYSLACAIQEMGIYPDCVCGSSLGEFASLAIAEVLSVEEVLYCIVKQAEIIEANCPKGCMIAIVHDHVLYNQPELNRNCELAAVNYDSHFVVSVHEKNKEAILNFLAEKGIIYIELPVCYGFHSSLINSVELAFKKMFSNIQYKKPIIPFVSCAYGDNVHQFPDNYLWNIARKPIQFQKSVQIIEGSGPNIYIDLGPSGTLANFARHNLCDEKASEVYSIITPFNQAVVNLKKLKMNEHIEIKERKDKNMNAYVFPGQGSQHKGMGGELFEEFKKLTEIADRVLGYSIKHLCLNNPDNKLELTQFTQPALYVVNALSYLKKIKESAKKAGFCSRT